MQPNIIDYASEQRPRRQSDWLRFAPLFAAVSAGFAWLKSIQYHGHGQLGGEQMTTLLFVGLSAVCLVGTFARFRRYSTDGRPKLVRMIALCIVVIAVDALAVQNLSTATISPNERLF